MREAFHFAINGFCVYAEYEDTFTSQIVKPLLRKLAKLQKKSRTQDHCFSGSTAGDRKINAGSLFCPFIAE